MVGAPTYLGSVVSNIRMMTGTLWHDWLSKKLEERGLRVMKEVNVTDGLPKRWSGTADAVWFSQEQTSFILSDLKTIKGEGFPFLYKEGIKQEHIWQLSAYYHALNDMGLRMGSRFSVCYLPMNEPTRAWAGAKAPEKPVEPLVLETRPLPKDMVWERLESVREAVEHYEKSVTVTTEHEVRYITEELAPEIEMVQKIYKNGAKHDLKLVPHWTTKFCPYPDQFCSCNTQKIVKVGEFVNERYKARKGYEYITPTVRPS